MATAGTLVPSLDLYHKHFIDQIQASDYFRTKPSPFQHISFEDETDCSNKQRFQSQTS